MGLLLCTVAFAACLLLGYRSLAAGLGAVLTTGYLYGILRANFLDTYAHFIFDSAVLGFYVAQLLPYLGSAPTEAEQNLRRWVYLLLTWAGLMFLIPIQHFLIQLVGLRGNAFLVPFLLVGGRLRGEDVRRLVVWVATLNLMALGFGMAEFTLGVPAFYPDNPVTAIIYNSQDVGGQTAFRIPACFANAHSYAGTMVMTLPWLVGVWAERRTGAWLSYFLMAGAGAAVIGVFLAAARVHIVTLFVLVVVVTFSGKLRGNHWLGWVLLLGGVSYLVSGEERMQRFLTLQKTGEVVGRIEGSVNMNFWELLTLYPMGNGMGGGGTSVPYFLRYLIRNPVMMENEYCRIMLEQGVVGLVLWFAFIAWVLSRPRPAWGNPWLLTWQLLWYGSLTNFALGWLGTGLMTAIPQSALFFLGVGLLAVGAPTETRRRRPAPEKSVGCKRSAKPLALPA